MKRGDAYAEDHPLTRLMISFYFKGGQPEQGCEFAHKSFREYLFAECIVETLKEYGHRLTERKRNCRRRAIIGATFPARKIARFMTPLAIWLTCSRPNGSRRMSGIIYSI